MSDTLKIGTTHFAVSITSDIVFSINFDVHVCCEECGWDVYQTDMECPFCQKWTIADIPGKMSNDIRDVDLAGSIRCEQCHTEFQLIRNAEYALDKFQWRIKKLGKIKTSKP